MIGVIIIAALTLTLTQAGTGTVDNQKFRDAVDKALKEIFRPQGIEFTAYSFA